MDNINLDARQLLVTDIMMGVSSIIDDTLMAREIGNVVEGNVRKYDVRHMETALSTEVDDNEYLMRWYEMDMKKIGKSEKTVEQYLRAFNSMMVFVDKNIRKITPLDVKVYLDRYGRGNQPSTYNNHRRFLSAVFSWMRKQQVILFNPIEALEVKKEVKKPIRFLSEEEIELLRVACKDIRERALMEFFLSTGMRVGELPAVKIHDIDWIRGDLVIYGKKTREYRIVFLNDTAKVYLKMYLDTRTDNSPYLFVSLYKPNKPLSEHGVREILRLLTRRSGVATGDVTPHIFRHTFATRMRQRGAKIEDIQALLGHKDISVTMKYYAATTTDNLRHAHMQFAS